MDKGNYGYLTNKGIILIALFMSIGSQTLAGEAIGSSIDCSKIKIDYMDRPELTQRERLEAMNNAFFESVNRFELCNLSTQTSAESETTNQDQPSSDTGSEEAKEAEDSNDDVALESVADPIMTGTELEESTAAVFDSSEEAAVMEKEIDASIATYTGGANGAIPEDIPKVNNDDAVTAQIRLAAEIETDPVKKEKLWNEYRKYKGLPVKTND